MQPHDTTNDIPHGYCHCGCGQKTTIAKKTQTSDGAIKGQPNLYLRGHRGSVAPRQTLAQKFWRRVDNRGENECWLWGGALTRRGCGTIRHNRRSLLAHRVSYELHFGPIPENLNVCHKCDNPTCVNPNHLFAGTQAENMRDCHSKRRYSPIKGQSNPNSKLTEANVIEIRRLAAAGVRKASIARQFGVTQTNVGDIVSRKRWSHIP